MTDTRRSPKVAAYATVGSVAVGLAVLSGRPLLVAFAAPFLLFACAGLRCAAPEAAAGRLTAIPDVAVEGDVISLALDLAVPGADRLDVALPRGRGLAVDGRLRAVRAARDAATPLRFDATCDRWGGHRPGPVAFRAWDALGVNALEGTLPDQRPLVRVHPRTEALRALVAPAATQALTGNRRSRARGDGIEYAEVRPYAPGDPLRRVNWRASGRGGGMYVTDRHPDRNADVVLITDSFADAHVDAIRPADDAVRLGLSLAAAYLRERDRVGLVGLGGGVWWLRGGLGIRQLHKVAAALIESQAASTFSFKGVSTIDRRVLPTGALLIALTPLIERRSAEVFRELQARGHDLVVVELDPAAYLPEPRGEEAALARRVWTAARDVQRERLRRAGAVVIGWRPGKPLDEVLLEVTTWRRALRSRSA